MSAHMPLRIAMGLLFILYLTPWGLLAYSLQEGMIGAEARPDGSLIIWNDSPLRVTLSLTFLANGREIYTVKETLSPGDRVSVRLPYEVAQADSLTLAISTLGIAEVEAKWSLG